MPFKKGQSGNPKGKPKGATNKTTRQLREMITNFLNSNFSKIEKDFNKLTPKERARVYCDLLQYGLPKLQSVELGIDKTTGRTVFEVRFNSDDKKEDLPQPSTKK